MKKTKQLNNMLTEMLENNLKTEGEIQPSSFTANRPPVDSSGSESEEAEPPASRKDDARDAGEHLSYLSQETTGTIPSDTEK